MKRQRRFLAFAIRDMCVDYARFSIVRGHRPLYGIRPAIARKLGRESKRLIWCKYHDAKIQKQKHACEKRHGKPNHLPPRILGPPFGSPIRDLGTKRTFCIPAIADRNKKCPGGSARVRRHNPRNDRGTLGSMFCPNGALASRRSNRFLDTRDSDHSTRRFPGKF